MQFTQRHLATAALALLAACSTTRDLPGPSGSAQIQLFHAAPDLGQVDLQAGGQTVRSSGYGTMTAPVQLEAGEQTVRVLNGAAELVAQSLTLADGSHTVVVLSRQGASVGLTAVPDTGLAKTDRANLRLISAPDEPRTVADSAQSGQSLLNVYVTPAGADLATANPLLSLETQVSSYSSFLYFDPGALDVTFTLVGSKTAVAKVTLSIAGGEAKAVVIQRAADGSFRTRVDPIG